MSPDPMNPARYHGFLGRPIYGGLADCLRQKKTPGCCPGLTRSVSSSAVLEHGASLKSLVVEALARARQLTSLAHARDRSQGQISEWLTTSWRVADPRRCRRRGLTKSGPAR